MNPLDYSFGESPTELAAKSFKKVKTLKNPIGRNEKNLFTQNSDYNELLQSNKITENTENLQNHNHEKTESNKSLYKSF